MKSNSITIVKLDPKRRPKPSTDWSCVAPMTDAEITAAALSDPDNPPLTTEQLRAMRPILNVAGLRRELKLTQKEFASRYKLSLALVRDWENHKTHPDGAARVLLRLIAHAPEVVAEMLRPPKAGKVRSTRGTASRTAVSHR